MDLKKVHESQRPGMLKAIVKQFRTLLAGTDSNWGRSIAKLSL